MRYSRLELDNGTVDLRIYCNVCNKNIMELKDQFLKSDQVCTSLIDTIRAIYLGHSVRSEHRSQLK